VQVNYNLNEASDGEADGAGAQRVVARSFYTGGMSRERSWCALPAHQQPLCLLRCINSLALAMEHVRPCDMRALLTLCRE
jgi:hypothetical protein